MAAEIQFNGSTGKTHYAQIRNTVGAIWNGASFVAYATADVANYDVAAVEQGTASSYFTADFPAVAAGVYDVIAKERVGGAPAEADVTVAEGEIQWNGGSVQATPISGGVYLASGYPLFGSGLYYPPSGVMSGQPVTLLSGLSFTASGVPVASFSGTVWLPSGSLIINTFASGVMRYVGDLALIRNLSGMETSGAKQSLLAAALKLSSRFNARSGSTYNADGTTVFMTQTPTLGSGMTPIAELGVGA